MPFADAKSGYSLAALLFGLIVAMLSLPALAEEGSGASPIMVPDPGADLWRAVRQRGAAESGSTQVRGVETGVLIQQRGEDWRSYRNNYFISIAAIVIGAVAALILVFFLIRGRVPIHGGRSGRRIRRFVEFDRILHWFTAILFIFLAITGLILLFGRFILLPLFGPEAFAMVASVSKEGHNLIGPLLLLSVFLFLIRFATKNLPARGDLGWLLKGGGIIGKKHVSAGFFNAGEKIWFWAVIVLGLIVSITGLILLFPGFGQGREIMQLALVVHGIAAVLFIAGSFGHIYIGTLGMEGSLESMTTGYVDENWAKAHHDRWYEKVRDQPEQAQGKAGRPTTSLRSTAD